LDENLSLLFHISDFYKNFDKVIVFVDVANGEKYYHLQIWRDKASSAIFSSEGQSCLEVVFEGMSRLTSLYEMAKCVEYLRTLGYLLNYHFKSSSTAELHYQTF